MKIEVSFAEGKKLEAQFNNFLVHSDQSKKIGGKESAPEPFDFFLASMALCAGHFVREFCCARDIDTDGIKIIQEDSKDPANPSKRVFSVSVDVPVNFPEKYIPALNQALKLCSVRKVIEAGPTFEVGITRSNDAIVKSDFVSQSQISIRQ